jgi:pyruvate,water dikinase
MSGIFNRLRGKGEDGQEPTVTRLEDLPPHEIGAAGGKGASLADMIHAGFPVPPGFVIRAEAFEAYLEQHGGVKVILSAMKSLDVNTQSNLDKAAASVREFILSKPIPPSIDRAVRRAYAELGANALVAVRSSAISEDGGGASFAGQQETFLNVRSGEAVIRYVKECWASFFTPRALFYRAQKGSLSDLGMAVVVQKMVNSEKSGVMFTVDPVQRRHDYVIIEAVFGLGEGIVSGQITPDHYVLDREDGSLVREHVSMQRTAVVLDDRLGGTREIELSSEQGRARVLTDAELQELMHLGVSLEAHFGQPQDVEWSISGSDMFLLQSRPITTL